MCDRVPLQLPNELSISTMGDGVSRSNSNETPSTVTDTVNLINITPINLCSKYYDDVIKWKTFSALLAFRAGNSPVTGEFPAQRPVTRTIDVSFDLRLNIQLSKQSRGWWFETPSRPLWRRCNVSCVLTLSLRCYRGHGELKMVSNQHIVKTKNPEHPPAAICWARLYFSLLALWKTSVTGLLARGWLLDLATANFEVLADMRFKHDTE